MNIKIEEIVEKYSNMIIQIAYQNVFNKSEAEDITQEVFIKLMKNIGTFASEEHMKAWIIRVTINLSKDSNKSFWNKNTTAIDEEIKFFFHSILTAIVAILAIVFFCNKNLI